MGHAKKGKISPVTLSVSPFELGADSEYQDEQLDNSCVAEWGAERIYLSDDFKVEDLAILLNDPDENFQPHQGQDLFLEALFIRGRS